MSDSASIQRLRHAALGMLADGNGVDAVAHLLGVPADVVMAWRTTPEPSPSAGAFVETLPSHDTAPARDAPARVRFDTELVYAASGTFRSVAFGFGVVLAVLGLYVAIAAVRGHARIDGLAEAAVCIIVTSWAAWKGLSWARRTLVLGLDGVVVPRLFGQDAIAYSDIAGYALAPSAVSFDGSSIKGQSLSIRSRRPGRDPLTVFIFDAYPVDREIFERLDEVVRANLGAAALPPLVETASRSAGRANRGGVGLYGVMLLLGLLQLWPTFSDSVRTLRRGTPPLAALQHVDGKVAAAGRCWTRSARQGGDTVIAIDVAQASGTVPLVVPCLADQDALIHHGWRRIAIDIDPDARPVPVVYQMSLDGRVLLSYEEASARQHRIDHVPALLGVVFPLVVVGLLLFGIRVSSRRSRQAPP